MTTRINRLQQMRDEWNVKESCVLCDGTGIGDDSEECATCDGVGVIPQVSWEEANKDLAAELAKLEALELKKEQTI